MILGVVAIRNRRGHILSAGREIVGRNLAGQCVGVVEKPAVGANREGESKPETNGHCGREWHPSPFSETHVQSLTYLAWCLLEYPESSERAADAPGSPARGRHHQPWPGGTLIIPYPRHADVDMVFGLALP